MRRKRLFLILGAMAACVGVTLIALAVPRSRPGVTSANFDRIEIGMAFAEVEAIFGREADSDVSARQGMTLAEIEAIFGKNTDPPCADFECDWIADDVDPKEGTYAQIMFVNNRVVEKYWVNLPEPETFIDKLRRWLGVAPEPVPLPPPPPPPASTAMAFLPSEPL